MINSFGTGKTTEADGEREADGSGGSCSGCSAVRVVRLFGLFGCSAVRLFGLFGCSAVRAVRLFVRRRLSSPAWPSASVAKPPPQQETAAAGSSSLFFFLCCCFCGCRLRKQRRGLSSPAWPAASVAKPPPQRSCSSDYLSLSFALSIISLSMKALLFECSCKILLADELILNVIVCVRPVAGLPVANRDPGVIFSLSIFIFLVRLINDARP